MGHPPRHDDGSVDDAGSAGLATLGPARLHQLATARLFRDGVDAVIGGRADTTKLRGAFRSLERSGTVAVLSDTIEQIDATWTAVKGASDDTDLDAGVALAWLLFLSRALQETFADDLCVDGIAELRVAAAISVECGVDTAGTVLAADGAAAELILEADGLLAATAGR